MTKAQGFDFSALPTVEAANKGAEIELRHPTTMEPLGAFVTVLGKDSDAFRALIRRNANAAAQRAHMARKRGKDPEPLTAEEVEARALDAVVTCVTGWRGVLKNGSPLEFTEANLRGFLSDYPWLMGQIDEAIGDLGNFIKS